MNAPGAGRREPPDQPTRDRLVRELDTTFLVEAGAGSGKTTALVDRMVALVAQGVARVEELAAVTFTRKAAGELRQRFQERLEVGARRAREGGGEGGPAGNEVAHRLTTALSDLDRSFMGTIHAFCARLLRERPVEARLDPAFRELTAPEERVLARWFWETNLERLVAEESPLLDDLAAVDLQPSQLYRLYQEMGEASDVRFPVDDVAPPDPEEVAELRAVLEELVHRAARGLPAVEPEKGWDSLQKQVRYARFVQAVQGFDDPSAFFDVLTGMCGRKSFRCTLNRWEIPKGEVRALEAEFNALVEEVEGGPEPPARKLVRQWRAHRYGPAIGFARAAAEAFARHRRATGQLSFHDLLTLTAELLRSSPEARKALGRRFPRILVDEFQDTDPLQAEILFLLASDPEDDPADDPADDAPGGPRWTRLTPRPGALFVVGDPKQSIYRFRRADISLYARVRSRMREIGEVLRLTANFRSVSEVEDLVAGVFDDPDAFPPEGDDRQAGYAPLDTLPSDVPDQRRGVFVHEVPPEHSGNKADVLNRDADALATWIAQRVEAWEGWRRSGGDARERPPRARPAEDFLILTRKKEGLARFAQALEARGLPVVVSGSGVGLEEELRELRALLDALADPGNPVLTVAALEGLFFGLDLEELLRHKDGGGRFDFRDTRNHGDAPVGAALERLHHWWDRSRHVPADQLVEEIADSIGLLPYAASGELGTIRAGALAFTLDTIRQAATSVDASLAGALEALSLVLDEDDSEVESPLEPERGGAVRVMNLHKAKGLEAKVVILANPAGSVRGGRDLLVERGEAGEVLGWTSVTEGYRYKRTVVAAPDDWEERAEREEAFARAEEVRLLYVAVTRAEEELVISRRGGKPDDSPWAALNPWLEEGADRLELEPLPPPPRPQVTETLSAIVAREDAVRDDRVRRAVAAYGFDPVTRLVKGEGADGDAPPSPVTRVHGWDEPTSTGPGGLEWGSAVHMVLEAAARGLDQDALRSVARTTLLELDRPARSGEPTELDTLLELVDRVRSSDLWARAMAAERRFSEQPFAVEREGGQYLEGVIDLVFREPDGWIIVDYKTDKGDDPEYEARLVRYREQVRLYGEAWAELTGEAVKETVVWRVR